MATCKQSREEPPAVARAPAAGTAVPVEDETDDEAAAKCEEKGPEPAQPLEREGEDDPADGDERGRAHPQRVLGGGAHVPHQELQEQAEHGAERRQEGRPRRPAFVIDNPLFHSLPFPHANLPRLSGPQSAACNILCHRLVQS
jgi:hypothetical protein